MSVFHDHFSGVATKYADYRPRYPAALFDYLATLAPRNSLVWDCAAGNGQASVDLARHFERIIATDASSQQIASAAPDPRIEYRVASAEDSGLRDRSVGLLTVAQALHWFHFEKFWQEAKRVLTDSALVAVWAYGINEVEGRAVNALVQEFYSKTVGPYWPPERTLVEEGYRSVPFPFRRLVPPAFRMEAKWTLAELLGYFSTWSATNRFIKVNGSNPVEPLAESLRAAWGDEEKPRLIVWPLTLMVGRNG
jgi:ubiquinone/menaquinone biosynthesis C-methylase UbiE